MTCYNEACQYVKLDPFNRNMLTNIYDLLYGGLRMRFLYNFEVLLSLNSSKAIPFSITLKFTSFPELRSIVHRVWLTVISTFCHRDPSYRWSAVVRSTTHFSHN